MEVLSPVSNLGRSPIRSEEPEVPSPVVRELISNAIAHRDYTRNGSVRVRVLPDVLEVSSPGAFPSGVTWESLIGGKLESVPRDPAIAVYLGMLGALEQVNRGFEVFRKFRKDNGPNSIVYEELGAGTTVIRVKLHAYRPSDPEPQEFPIRRSNIECRIGSSRQELSAAFHLIYEQYLKAGLMKPNSYRMRVTPYHLLPSTEVLVALDRGVVTCTLSLVRDGKLGLPMEACITRKSPANAYGVYRWQKCRIWPPRMTRRKKLSPGCLASCP